MRDLCDVDASGGNVRSDQDVESALAKALHGPVALVLRHIALKGNGSVTVLDQFLCQLPCSALGACEDDGGFNIADAIIVLNYLFALTDAVTCLDACDANDDAGIDIADAVFLLGALFAGGPLPLAPYPDCGEDPTVDTLDCVTYGAPCL